MYAKSDAEDNDFDCECAGLKSYWRSDLLFRLTKIRRYSASKTPYKSAF